MSNRAPKVLALTNLFPNSWDQSKSTFNYEIFKRLHECTDLTLLVPVSIYEVLKHPLAFFKLKYSSTNQWPWAKYFVYFHLPRMLIQSNDFFMFLSLVVQHPVLTLIKKWDVLFGSWLFPDAVALQKISTLRGIPLVTMALGSDINATFRVDALKKKVLGLVRKAHKTITVSKALENTLFESGIRKEQTQVIYTGVDKHRFRSMDKDQARQFLNLEKNAQIVLFVGNLITTKGCVELANAVETLRPRFPNLQLIFVGGGPCKTTIVEQFGNRCASKEIYFVGKVLPKNLPEWFCAADVFALPSYQEGVPNVILEAMACGVSIVSTNVGGIPEVLDEQCGLIVPAKEIAPLALAIEQLLNSPKDSKTIQKQAERFDWDDCVFSIREVLNSAHA
jgi:glycosyltransferase involved in cell wall biosynthesis